MKAVGMQGAEGQCGAMTDEPAAKKKPRRRALKPVPVDAFANQFWPRRADAWHLAKPSALCL